MDTKQISQLIGRNFYEVFKPNDKAIKAREEIQQFLKTATDIDRQVWACRRLDGIKDIAFIRARRGSPLFIVNTKTREVLADGQFFNQVRQVTDKEYRRYPLITVNMPDGNINVFDPINNVFLFKENQWWIESYFSYGDKLFALVEETEGDYKLYELTQKKYIMDIPGILDNREDYEPFCRMSGIVHSFYGNDDTEYYFLLNDGTLHTDEEMLDRYSEEEEYYDDDYYEDEEWQ